MIDKNFIVGLFWAESSPGKEDYVCLQLIPSEPFQSGLQLQGTQVVKALLSAEPYALQRPLCCWPTKKIGVAINFYCTGLFAAAVAIVVLTLVL